MGHYLSEVPDYTDNARLIREREEKPKRVEIAKKIIRTLMADGIDRTYETVRSRVLAKEEGQGLMAADIYDALWLLEDRGHLDFTKAHTFKKSWRHKKKWTSSI